MNRIGAIVVPPGVIIDKHEKLTADFLAVRLGLDITFLVPNRRKGERTPDFKMKGLIWEAKSPKGKSPRTIENNIRQALKQSSNIIIDLRRTDGRVPTKRYVDRIELEFNKINLIKNILIITKQETIVDLER